MQNFTFDNKNSNSVRIDSNMWRLYLLENINFNTFCLGLVWDKMVCLDNFVEFSIFNFVIGHNRKIPSGLTEIHEVDLYMSGLWKD